MIKTYAFFVILLSMSIAVAQSEDGNYKENSYPTDSYAMHSPSNNHNKNFAITPSISTLSFPHPFDAALEVVLNQNLGIKYSQSLQPTGHLDGNEASLDNRSIAIRSYVDQGPWFFGVAYGQHEIEIKRNENINGFNTNIYANVKSDYLTPMTGWKWVYSHGFTVGLEIGWIFALNPSTDVYSNQEYNPLVVGNTDYQSYRRQAEDQANKYVRDGVPDIGLLELGWTF